MRINQGGVPSETLTCTYCYTAICVVAFSILVMDNDIYCLGDEAAINLSTDQDIQEDLDNKNEGLSLKKLESLDEQLGRSKWVVPVRPGDELELLLKESIRLAKEGLYIATIAVKFNFIEALGVETPSDMICLLSQL